MSAAPSRWFLHGDHAFEAMLAAINAAVASVRLETYIYTDSDLGRRFRGALTEAASRGVKVRVLLDAWGSMALPDTFWEPLVAAGGEWRHFNPLSLEQIAFRDHRKLLICDERAAFVGGRNITADNEGDGVRAGWRDLGIQLGEAFAQRLARAFDHMFAHATTRHQLLARVRRPKNRLTVPLPEGQILLSGPGRGRNAIRRTLLRDLETAGDVAIVAAYFVPDRALRRRLLKAARRGARVRLVLPSKTDVPMIRLASQSLYGRLLAAGAEVYEYQPQILHTKLIVVDAACYVGSSNLDARSLQSNYEVMVRLADKETVRGALEVVEDHLVHCAPITRAAWRASRGLWQRLKERWSAFVVNKLDPWLTRRQLRHLRS